MQQTHGVSGPVVRPERVGADQFGQLIRLVGVSAADRAHLVQNDRHAGLRDLPGSFGSGEPAANDMYRFQGHAWLTSNERKGSRAGPCTGTERRHKVVATMAGRVVLAPGNTMARFSPSDAALEGFRLTREHPGVVLAWSAVYFGGILLIGLTMLALL
eukprot:gene46455-62135_t